MIRFVKQLWWWTLAELALIACVIGEFVRDLFAGANRR